MRKTLFACAFLYATSLTAQIKEVPFTQVQLNDIFWTPRIEVNRLVSIPSAFRECEKNGRFDNFALAAGLIKGEHRGDYPFDDTDPYKIIEGASYSLAVHYDAQLDHYLDSVINIIALAQEPDGYLTTCVTNRCERLSAWWGTHRWEKINSHELYNAGHLIESAVAHYKATGKRTLLDVAIKNADLICQTFGPHEGQIHRPDGHPIIEMALCKLYKTTGDKRYLEGARYFIEETGRLTDGREPSEYSQDHKPILQQDEIVGHAVRAGYLYSGVADMAALTGDTAYFHALERIWENMSSKKLFITGGIGSRSSNEGFGPNYELISRTAYCETCAAIANVYWNYRMFLATGESKYIDIVERALYNNVLSGVSLSGDRFFYDNPLESTGNHKRQAWFGCACCPGNITRFIASVPGYIYAQRGKDIYVNLYVQGKAKIGNVEIEQMTDYPWDGKVRIRINKGGGKFAIMLRLPSWLKQSPTNNDLYTYVNQAKPYGISVNGKMLYPENHDYITLKRRWKKGDVIELSFPMKVRYIEANEQVEDLRGKLAIERGPLVYCLETCDQLDREVFDKHIFPTEKLTTRFKEDELGGIVLIDMIGKSAFPGVEPIDAIITAIPYATWNNRGPQKMIIWIPRADQ